MHYEKAFDSMWASEIMNALVRQGLLEAYVKILKNYCESTATIMLH